ncbi:hypothetical protein EK904_011779 [Melospiza melodia maxima]|nr:hypothetical protein EK904_011779 [Melospiza melodia maxima]
MMSYLDFLHDFPVSGCTTANLTLQLAVPPNLCSHSLMAKPVQWNLFSMIMVTVPLGLHLQ